jgi:hypothetical protein
LQKNNYTFYHGTSAENLRSIKKNGIDTEGTDFYATTNIWDTFGYGCDKVGNWDKKSSVLIIKPKEQAKLLDIGNPFYGIKMGFVTYNSEYYIFEVNQAELDNYAKANKYDAYIYPESLSGGGREVDYATRHRWIQILNKDAFTYEYLINKFPCFNYKKYNDNPSEYGKEYRTKIKQALVDNNIPEFEEFPERKIAEEKFDKISDELESSHYNHKMIEEKYGYETIMQAAHQIMRVPIYKEIEKFYLKNIDSAVLYDKTNELLGFNIEVNFRGEKIVPATYSYRKAPSLAQAIDNYFYAQKGYKNHQLVPIGQRLIDLECLTTGDEFNNPADTSKLSNQEFFGVWNSGGLARAPLAR